MDTALRFGKLNDLRPAFEAAARNELTQFGVNSELLEMWSVKRVFKLKKKLDLIVGDLFIDIIEDEEWDLKKNHIK